MAIRAQLSGIANEVVGEDKWLFDGPIEKLLKHMNRPIMIMPEQRIIYVTQYSTFSQR